MSSSFEPRSPSPTLTSLEDLVSNLGAGPSDLRRRPQASYDADDDDDDDDGDDRGGGGYVIPSLRRPSPPILTTAALALRSVPSELLSRDGGAKSYRQALRRERKRLRRSSTSPAFGRSRRSDTESPGATEDEQSSDGNDDKGTEHLLERAVREHNRRRWPALDVLDDKLKPDEERDLHRPPGGWTLGDEVLAIVDRLDRERRGRCRAASRPEPLPDLQSSEDESGAASSSSESSASRSRRSSTRSSRSSPRQNHAKGKGRQTPLDLAPDDSPLSDELATSSSASILAPLLVEAQKVMTQLWEELAREGGRSARRGRHRADEEDGWSERSRSTTRSSSRSRSRSRSQSQSRGRGRSRGKSARSSGMDSNGEGEDREPGQDGQGSDADAADDVSDSHPLTMRRHRRNARPKDWHAVLRILARLPGISEDAVRRTQERLEALYGAGGALAQWKEGEGRSVLQSRETAAADGTDQPSGRLEASLGWKAAAMRSSTSLDAAILDVSHLLPLHPHPSHSSLRALHAARPSWGLLGQTPPTMLEGYTRKRKIDAAARGRERRDVIKARREALSRREGRRLRKRARGRGAEDSGDEEEGETDEEVDQLDEEILELVDGDDEDDVGEEEGEGLGKDGDDEDRLREALLSRATPEGEE